MGQLLTFQGVEISYHGKPVVEDLNLSLRPGEILGIAGESGSGKSTLLRAAMHLLGPGGRVTRGEICFREKKLSQLPERELRQIRGREMGMIFQDAAGSLCPVRTVGDQIYQCLSAHAKLTRKDADARALELFDKLGLPEGKRILASYPLQLSGGMCQRVAVAMATLPGPAVLLADEPTSALDTVSQRQVAEELLALRTLCGAAILLVTHQIGMLSAVADTVLVLRQGRTVEYGPADRVLRRPASEYTKELLDAVPRLCREPEGGKRCSRFWR